MGGTMDFDYRKRCVKPNGNFDRIYYGHCAKDYDGPGADEVYDLVTDYAELSARGRRPGQRHEVPRHFFNKRIMTDDERIGRAAIQAGRDESRIRARYGVGGASRAEEVAAAAGSAGGGGAARRESTEEKGNEEVTS